MLSHGNRKTQKVNQINAKSKRKFNKFLTFCSEFDDIILAPKCCKIITNVMNLGEAYCNSSFL